MTDSWERIDDPTDPRLADYLALNDQPRREAEERRSGFFICEGLAVVTRLLDSGLGVRSVVATPEKAGRVTVPDGVDCYIVARTVLAQAAGFDFHRGVLASARRPEPRPSDSLAGPLVVCEGINDHQNLGAILRSARALGARGAVLDPTTADPFYRRCVRVSMGAVLDLPMARLQRWPQDFDQLRGGGAFLVALSPRGVSIGDVVVPSDRYPALIVGSEGPGLSRAAMDAADIVAGIAMVAGQDSLNAGHAFAIAAHRLYGV